MHAPAAAIKFIDNAPMNQISGTKGYSEVAELFIEASNEIDFRELHQAFIEFIPAKASRILDVGAGSGRDAAALADMGHTVVAVEPIKEFRCAGKERYNSSTIEWLDDSLPMLPQLAKTNQFDVVLASAVWHHLNHDEQQQAMKRIAQLLISGGIFALTLRHGPAGVGTHVFPTDGQQTIENAKSCGLTPLLHLPNQPSLMSGKEAVTWTRLVFKKA